MSFSLPNKSRYPFWLLALFLCAFTAMLYSVSLGHNFLFDEENIILNNPTIRSFDRIPDLLKHGYFYFGNRSEPRWDEYYRPLTSLTLMVDWHFWGPNPLGYNLTNLFLHLALCLLYFRLLETLLGHRLAAFLAALLYAVHTMHTEAVTYTASRGDILGIVLMLGAMLAYARGRRAAAAACYFFALFSKETMIMLPFYLLVLDVAWVKTPLRELPKKMTPYFAMMAAFWVFRRFVCPVPFAPVEGNVRAILLRMLGMGDGILQYLRAILAPEYFKPFSDVPQLYGFGDPLIWTALTVAALLSAAWLLAFRYQGLAFLGMTIFLAGLAPHFQIVHVYPEWAEHFICISSLGLFLLLGLLTRSVWESGKAKWAALFFAAYLPFFAFVSWRTWQRNEIYADTERYYTLLSQTDTPYRFFGYQQLALALLREGRTDEAYVPLHAALQQEFRSEVTHQLLGLYYQQKELPEKALKEFRLAYFYSGDNTSHLLQIGNTLVWLARYAEAAKIYEMAVRLAPASAAPYAQLMGAYELLDEPARVREWAEKGFSRFRNDPRATAALLMALARFEYRTGDFEESRRLLRRVAAECPDAPGTADLARLELGEMSPAEFLRFVDERYPHYRKAAPAFVLMSYVLQGKREEAAAQLAGERENIRAYSKRNRLFERDLARAEKFVAG